MALGKEPRLGQSDPEVVEARQTILETANVMASRPVFTQILVMLPLK